MTISIKLLEIHWLGYTHGLRLWEYQYSWIQFIYIAWQMHNSFHKYPDPRSAWEIDNHHYIRVPSPPFTLIICGKPLHCILLHLHQSQCPSTSTLTRQRTETGSCFLGWSADHVPGMASMIIDMSYSHPWIDVGTMEKWKNIRGHRTVDIVLRSV